MTDALERLAAEVTRLREELGRASYYDFLGVAPRADYLAIREAFHARAQALHPDRFVALEDEQLKKDAYVVYKRITEAYNVLCDPELRQAYDATRAQGAVRLSSEARARRLDADERQVTNSFARIYLRSGRKKLERGDLDGAWIDVQLGLSLEQSEPLLQLRTRLEALRGTTKRKMS